MAYKLEITERAEQLLDQLVYYLLYRLKNEQAAGHLLDEISKVYDRLEENPYQFTESRDVYLKSKQYREAVTTDMNYAVIFKIEDDTVYVLGVFHGLENYRVKM